MEETTTEEETLVNQSDDADFATGTFGVFPMGINISNIGVISMWINEYILMLWFLIFI